MKINTMLRTLYLQSSNRSFNEMTTMNILTQVCPFTSPAFESEVSALDLLWTSNTELNFTLFGDIWSDFDFTSCFRIPMISFFSSKILIYVLNLFTTSIYFVLLILVQSNLILNKRLSKIRTTYVGQLRPFFKEINWTKNVLNLNFIFSSVINLIWNIIIPFG